MKPLLRSGSVNIGNTDLASPVGAVKILYSNYDFQCFPRAIAPAIYLGFESARQWLLSCSKDKNTSETKEALI